MHAIAEDSETYMYWDPDSQSSGDGTARWIIGQTKPSFVKDHDLAGDGFCNGDACINSNERSLPPKEGEWSMYCGEGGYEPVWLVMQQHTTTVTSSTTSVTTSTNGTVFAYNGVVPMVPKALQLTGACSHKTFIRDGLRPDGQDCQWVALLQVPHGGAVFLLRC